MTHLILTKAQQDVLLAWAAPRVQLEGKWPPESEALAAVEADTGKIQAVMVVNGFMEDSAMIHFATDGRRAWANRKIVSGFFAYLFLYKRLPRVIGFTPADNVSMLKMLLQLGFFVEGRVRKSSDGRQQSIMTSMFADECRWLEPQE